MSNEYKDWLYDRVQDVVLDAGVIDKVTEVNSSPIYGHKMVYGLKNGEKVAFVVWLDDFENEWKFERRETNI